MHWEDDCASTLAKDYLHYKECQKLHPSYALAQSALLNNMLHDLSMAKKFALNWFCCNILQLLSLLHSFFCKGISHVQVTALL